MTESTQNFTNNSNPSAEGVAMETKDRIASGAHQGIDAATKAAHPGVDRAASAAHQAVDSADQMAHHAAEAMDKAGDKGEELIAAATNYMNEHPMMTIGAAITAGFVLSRILSSR